MLETMQKILELSFYVNIALNLNSNLFPKLLVISLPSENHPWVFIRIFILFLFAGKIEYWIYVLNPTFFHHWSFDSNSLNIVQYLYTYSAIYWAYYNFSVLCMYIIIICLCDVTGRKIQSTMYFLFQTNNLTMFHVPYFTTFSLLQLSKSSKKVVQLNQ